MVAEASELPPRFETISTLTVSVGEPTFNNLSFTAVIVLAVVSLKDCPPASDELALEPPVIHR